MSDEPIKTTTSLLEVQCPRCGSTDCEYIDDLEHDLEQHRCTRCGQAFNVRWEREIQVIGWDGEGGQFHEVWNSDLIVACQTQAMYYVCFSLWKEYGNQCPHGIDAHVWEMLCSAMRSIDQELPGQEHEFTPPAKEGQA